MTKIQAIRGMNDLLPVEITLWQTIEAHWRELLTSYAYQEIRLPILEKTALFKRGIGEATDIVEKEMYTFNDRHAEQLTLRPEGTAGCVRAAIEHGLLYHQHQKLWYSGPMFRYERPQKGRYRQFHQFGVETFGYAGASIEVELLLLLARFWRKLGLATQIKLQINSLGNLATREIYRVALVDFCERHYAELDEDCQRRLLTNPLRILDSKNLQMQSLLVEAPKITDYLEPCLQQDFKQLQQLLTENNVAFTVNPCLVRGLDYYTGSVFEWVTEVLGAQGAVAAGGRYDDLVTQLGGPPVSAAGFAVGVERVVELYKLHKIASISTVGVYIIAVIESQGLILAEKLRDQLPATKILLDMQGGNLKTQLKRADKSGAKYALIIDENAPMIICKNLRESMPQMLLNSMQLIDYLRSAG